MFAVAAFVGKGGATMAAEEPPAAKRPVPALVALSKPAAPTGVHCICCDPGPVILAKESFPEKKKRNG